MLKKVFLITNFGDPIPWIDKYIENCNMLAPYGFEWYIFTPYQFKMSKNVTVYNMTEKDFLELAGRKLNITPKTLLTPRMIGDFLPAFGVIFDELIEGFDFWGHTNFDVVYGRLDRYLPDTYLESLDIFSNDPGTMCGPFSLLRNTPVVNNLYQEHENYPGILTENGYYAYDEEGFSQVVNQAVINHNIRVEYKFWQEHDSMKDHLKCPQLKQRRDGTLLNRLTKQEIMMFHFRKVKAWAVR